MLENITIGIITGILTTTVLFIISKLFNDSFLPWYRQYLYHGINVSGTWFCHSALTQKINLELTQNCQHLKGTAVVVRDDNHREEGQDSLRVFAVTGEIKDGFVLLTMKSKDQKRLGLVSLLLQVSGDGSELLGVSNAYNPSLSQIEPHFKCFYRNESRANSDRSVREFHLEESTAEDIEEDQSLALEES